ncbi:MAG: hypothetical protein KatS3mg105_1058 [Gemmatales bacterium]|nr:MAG: hypothetical protein KatS3mg105_1058 [Gemmatales bacterium]
MGANLLLPTLLLAIGDASPVSAQVSAKQIQGLISDLDHPEYRRRERAFQRLCDLGPAVIQPLEKALQDKPSLESTRRIERILHIVRSRSQLGHFRSAVEEAEAILERLPDRELEVRIRAELFEQDARRTKRLAEEYARYDLLLEDALVGLRQWEFLFAYETSREWQARFQFALARVLLSKSMNYEIRYQLALIRDYFGAAMRPLRGMGPEGFTASKLPPLQPGQRAWRLVACDLLQGKAREGRESRKQVRKARLLLEDLVDGAYPEVWRQRVKPFFPERLQLGRQWVAE